MRCAPRDVAVRRKACGDRRSACRAPFDGAVGKGQAVRIFTGAPVPEGADTILIQENARRIDAATVEVVETVAAGRHIRRAGLDFEQGDTLLDRHRVLDAAALSLAASANHTTLSVVRPAAGRHHRHRRRIAAAGQHAGSRPDHLLQRLWRRRGRQMPPEPTRSTSASCATARTK